MLIYEPEIREQACIRGQLHAPPVEGLRRALAHRIEMLDRHFKLMLRFLVFANQPVVRRQIQRPRRTIHDRRLALAGFGKQSTRPCNCRDFEGPREDHAMRCLAAVLRHDGRNLVHLELSENRGKQMFHDHDRSALHRFELIA